MHILPCEFHVSRWWVPTVGRVVCVCDDDNMCNICIYDMAYTYNM